MHGSRWQGLETDVATDGELCTTGKPAWNRRAPALRHAPRQPLTLLEQSGAALRSYAHTPELVDGLLTGELDAALVTLAVAREFVAARAGGLAIVGPTLMLDTGVGIGVREGDSRLRNRLNRAIAAMKEDGSLNALIRKWFGPEATTF